MRQDQLERARQARWRQDGNALLTLDDAERWLAETPLCLYLPRQAHLPVPAPSFVEAIAGHTDATPGPERIAAAEQMLARLVASGAVVALNLLGSSASYPGEQPDFLATPEALPYLYALQPERNPRRAPSTSGAGRVSPLSLEIWKLLEREGAMQVGELRSKLGREVTEAAILRSLGELWHTMRVTPIPAEHGSAADHGAHWELLQARHRRELNMGSTQSQTTALSILASFYLQSAVAATGEEIEIFLSPVASRSRIRDVVHGLSATRQLASFPLNGEAQLHVEGTLPELPDDDAAPVDAELTPAGTGEDAGLEQNEPSAIEAAASSPASPREKRPYPPRPSFGDRARGSFAAGGDRRAPAGDRPPRREGGSFRKPAAGGFRRRAEGGAGPRSSANRPRSTAPRTDRPRSERPARTNRFTSSGRERRPAVGFRGPRPGAAQGTGESAGAERPSRPAFHRGPGRPAGGEARPPRAGGKFPGSKPRFGASDRPAGGGFNRPKRTRDEGGERAFSRPAGDGRPPRAEGDRPFRKPYEPRSERPFKKPFAREGSERPFKKPYPPRGDRPTADRPFRKPFASKSGSPRSGGPGRPYGDRPRSPRPAPAGGDATPRRTYTPRPRPEGNAAGTEGRERRPYNSPTGGAPRGKGPGAGARAGARPGFGARPGGFGKSGSSSKSGGFQKPGSFGKGPAKPGGFRKAGGSFGKPGGFSKPGGAPKRFGAPRPGGGRPPAKGGFKPGGNRAGGAAPPRRKPRPESGSSGDEG